MSAISRRHGMMIAGAATLIPSDRLPCEGEGRPLSAIKQHHFFLCPFTTHMLTLVYTHTHRPYIHTDKETNKDKAGGGWVGVFKSNCKTLYTSLCFSEPTAGLF